MAITFHNNLSQTNSLSRKWVQAVHEWHPAGVLPSGGDEWELYSALNRQVKHALEYHQRRLEDRQYALAADVPLQPDLRQALAIGSSAHIGHDWRVDVSPEMVLERFEEVATGSSFTSEDTEKMRDIIKKGIEKQKEYDEGIYDRNDDWEEEDDDSTSDYDPEDDGSAEEEVEEDEDDEMMEDLDPEALKRDMDYDVEVMRIKIERYQIGS
jgi:hypothetical protein